MTAGRQRIDRWLWFARFAKTRSLAARLVADGFVRKDGRRVEASAKAVSIGDVLTIAAPHRTVVIRVLSPGERRGPAAEALALYEILEAPRDTAALVTGPPGD